jgi:hypothetical protein
VCDRRRGSGVRDVHSNAVDDTECGTELAFFRRILGQPLFHLGSAIADVPTKAGPAGRSESSVMPPLKLPHAHAEDAGRSMPVD